MILQNEKRKGSLAEPHEGVCEASFPFLFRFPHVAGFFGSGAELLTLIPFLE